MNKHLTPEIDMQVAYATQYELSPFEWRYPEMDSVQGRLAGNAVYHGTTGEIAGASNNFYAPVTKEAAE